MAAVCNDYGFVGALGPLEALSLRGLKLYVTFPQLNGSLQHLSFVWLAVICSGAIGTPQDRSRLFPKSDKSPARNPQP